MFPRTGTKPDINQKVSCHVESIVLLSKLADDHIELEIDPLELEKIVDRVPPSYPEIKQYILNKYKIKVPSLYIAQVKRKLGLNLRECYNKPWSVKSRPAPQVSPEKEAAIMDALRYFNVIE